VKPGGTANANVATLLERSASRRGGAPALVAPDGRALWTFEDLGEAAARLAGGLRELGVGDCDRVLVLARNPRELYQIVTGVIWAGAAAVLPPMSLPPGDALRVAAASRPRAVIAELPLWGAALRHAELRGAPVRVVVGPWRLRRPVSVLAVGRHQPIPPRAVPPDSPAVMSWTTGSTGSPRLVPRSHGVLRAQHTALAALRGLSESDRDFVGLPVLALHNLGSAVTSILAPRSPGSRRYGDIARAALARTGATSAAGFPHLYESAVRGAPSVELDQLRSIYVGGSRVRTQLLGALKVMAPEASVTVVYGSTEIEPISAIGADEYRDLLARSDPAGGVPVGAVLEGLELRLEPDPEVAPPLGAKRYGTILLRGPRACGAAGPGGWVDTGDVGRLDESGRLWLLGRGADAWRGLHQAEVERVVEALPWVRRAAFARLVAGPKSEALLAVEPAAWGASGVRAAQLGAVNEIVRKRRWPACEVMLLERLPVLPGAAAKVDYGRLRELASSG
jgi:acyl-CoA synthetase (AMP-forming)/AMP-acid ligase II